MYDESKKEKLKHIQRIRLSFLTVLLTSQLFTTELTTDFSQSLRIWKRTI